MSVDFYIDITVYVVNVVCRYRPDDGALYGATCTTDDRVSYGATCMMLILNSGNDSRYSYYET